MEVKPVRCSTVRWVQPIMLEAGAEPVTRADDSTSLAAQDFGITVTRSGKRILVPWSNVKQADADE